MDSILSTTRTSRRLAGTGRTSGGVAPRRPRKTFQMQLISDRIDSVSQPAECMTDALVVTSDSGIHSMSESESHIHRVSHRVIDEQSTRPITRAQTRGTNPLQLDHNCQTIDSRRTKLMDTTTHSAERTFQCLCQPAIPARAAGLVLAFRTEQLATRRAADLADFPSSSWRLMNRSVGHRLRRWVLYV